MLCVALLLRQSFSSQLFYLFIRPGHPPIYYPVL